MKDVTSARGLRHLRTAITARTRSKPPQKGTAHLDLYLLSKEKQRLEAELALLQQRQGRIQAHLAEISRAMDTLEQEAEQERRPQNPSENSEVGERQRPMVGRHGRRQWTRMVLSY